MSPEELSKACADEHYAKVEASQSDPKPINWQQRAEAAMRARGVWEQKYYAQKSLLGEILATIHKDGGHYSNEYGDQKATDDAIKIVIEDRVKLDAQKQRAERLEKAVQEFVSNPYSHSESCPYRNSFRSPENRICDCHIQSLKFVLTCGLDDARKEAV